MRLPVMDDRSQRQGPLEGDSLARGDISSDEHPIKSTGLSAYFTQAASHGRSAGTLTQSLTLPLRRRARVA